MVAVTMFYSAIHGIFISHPTCLSAREPLLWNKALFYLNPIMYPTNVSDFFLIKKKYMREQLMTQNIEQLKHRSCHKWEKIN